MARVLPHLKCPSAAYRGVDPLHAVLRRAVPSCSQPQGAALATLFAAYKAEPFMVTDRYGTGNLHLVSQAHECGDFAPFPEAQFISVTTITALAKRRAIVPRDEELNGLGRSRYVVSEAVAAALLDDPHFTAWRLEADQIAALRPHVTQLNEIAAGQARLEAAIRLDPEGASPVFRDQLRRLNEEALSLWHAVFVYNAYRYPILRTLYSLPDDDSRAAVLGS